MKTQILLKLEYLMGNFESIDRIETLIYEDRTSSKYFVRIYANQRYFSKEGLHNALLEYFENLPIKFSIKYNEG